MSGHDTLEQGRDAYKRRAWGDAYRQLLAAQDDTSLTSRDLEQLGTAAYLIGRDIEST